MWTSPGYAARPRLALLVLVGSASACKPGHTDPARTTLSVFAASSLTEAFEDLGRRFEGAHRDIDVKLTFAGSQVLRLQLEHGAAADVFASANEAHVRALSDGGVVSGSRIFAYNALVVIVPRNNPASITSFEELPRASRLVIGTSNVPVGIYTRKVLERAATRFGHDFAEAVRSRVVSEESNVRLVRAKVELGEADAAIVYRTDAIATGKVRVVAIPDAINERARYPVAAVTGSAHPDAARQFIAFVLSSRGQATLTHHGFVAATQ